MLSVFLFAFISCDKDNDIVSRTITAKVENASEYSNVVEVKLMVYDRTTQEVVPPFGNITLIDHYIELARGIWKDGGFTIELPKTLASNHLRALIRDGSPSVISNKQPTLVIKKENIRIGIIHFVGIDIDGNAVATFSSVKTGENVDTEAFYTYVDSDVTISGYTYREGAVRPADEDAPTWFETTTTYSIKWKKGWNIWCLSTSHIITGYTAITTEQWSTTPVSNLKWYGGDRYLSNF